MLKARATNAMGPFRITTDSTTSLRFWLLFSALSMEYYNMDSVYKRFARWPEAKVWHRVFEELAKDADFEDVFLDSTVVRAHQHTAGVPKKRWPSAWAPSGRIGHEGPRVG
jgi:hypothetical protein